MYFDDSVHAKVPEFKEFKEKMKAILSGFEKRRDWPDLIKAIGQLQKILQKYQHIGVMPEKLLLCKRLGQTLNPSLPSGVHRKVLETYQIIFKMIDPQQLATDIPVYSAGLFKLFPDASMDVKPLLLSIFEETYVSLEPEQIRPCLGGLLCALLPVLEEKNDLNSRVEAMISKVETNFRKQGMKSAFMAALWENLCHHGASRIACLQYLQKILPKSSRKKNVTSLSESDLGCDDRLAINALCVCLSSNKEMVIRGVLDLLNTSFMLHEIGGDSKECLSDVQVATIVKHALALMTREELPLTRRISRWFSGEEKPCPAYFTEFAAVPIKRAFSQLIADASSVSAHGNEANAVTHLMDLLGQRGIQEDIIGCYIKFLRTLTGAKQVEAYQAVRTHVMFDFISEALTLYSEGGEREVPEQGHRMDCLLVVPDHLSFLAAPQRGEAVCAKFGVDGGVTVDILDLLAILVDLQKEVKRKPGGDRLLKVLWVTLHSMNSIICTLEEDTIEAEIRDFLLTSLSNCQQVIHQVVTGFSESMRGKPTLTLAGTPVGLAGNEREEVVLTPFEFFVRSYRTVAEKAVVFFSEKGGLERLRNGAGNAEDVSSASEDVVWQEDDLHVVIVIRSLQYFADMMDLLQRQRFELLRDAQDEGEETPGFSTSIPTEVAFEESHKVLAHPTPDPALFRAGESTALSLPLWIHSLLALCSHSNATLAFFCRKILLSLCFAGSHKAERGSIKIQPNKVLENSFDRAGERDEFEIATKQEEAQTEVEEPAQTHTEDLSQVRYVLPAEVLREFQKEHLHHVVALLWGDIHPRSPHLTDACDLLFTCHEVSPKNDNQFYKILSSVMSDDLTAKPADGLEGAGGIGTLLNGTALGVTPSCQSTSSVPANVNPPPKPALNNHGFARFCTLFDVSLHKGKRDTTLLSEPVRQVLDTLASPLPNERAKGERFLFNASCSAFNVKRLFDPYFTMLFESDKDAEVAEYVVASLKRIIHHAPPRMIRHLVDAEVTPEVARQYAVFLESSGEAAQELCYLAALFGLCTHVIASNFQMNEVSAGVCSDLLEAILYKSSSAGNKSTMVGWRAAYLTCRKTAALFSQMLEALVLTLQHALSPPMKHALAFSLCECIAITMAALGYSAENGYQECKSWGNSARQGSVNQSHQQSNGSLPSPKSDPNMELAGSPMNPERESSKSAESPQANTNTTSVNWCTTLVTTLATFVSQTAAADDIYLYKQWCDVFLGMMPLVCSVLPAYAGMSRSTFVVIINNLIEESETEGELSLYQCEVICASLCAIAQVGCFILSADPTAEDTEDLQQQAMQLSDVFPGENLAANISNASKRFNTLAGVHTHCDVVSPQGSQSFAQLGRDSPVFVNGGGPGEANDSLHMGHGGNSRKEHHGWGPSNLFSGIFSGFKENRDSLSDVPTIVQAGKAAFCEGYDDFLAMLNRFVRASSSHGGVGAGSLHTISFLLQVMHALHPWHFINAFVHRWSEQILLNSWKPIVEGPNECQEAYLFLLNLTPNVNPDTVVSSVVELSTEIVVKHRAIAEKGARERVIKDPLGAVSGGMVQGERGGGAGSAEARRHAASVMIDGTEDECVAGVAKQHSPPAESTLLGEMYQKQPAQRPSQSTHVPFPAHYEVFCPDFLYRYLHSITEKGKVMESFLKGKANCAQEKKTSNIPVQTAEKLARLVKIMPIIITFIKEMTGTRDRDASGTIHAFSYAMCLRLLVYLVKVISDIAASPPSYGQDLSGVCRTYLADKKGNKLFETFSRVLECIPKLMCAAAYSTEHANAGTLSQNAIAPDPLAAALDMVSMDLPLYKSASYLTAPEKIGPLMAILQQQYFSGLFKIGEDQADRAALMRKCHIRKINASLVFLVETVKTFTPMGVWQLRVPVLEHVNDSQFFRVDHHTLTLWRTLFAALVGGSDAAVRSMIDATLSRIQLPTGVGSVFLSAEREAQNRARSLRRLAFLMSCSGQHLSNAQLLTAILERLIESMKYVFYVLLIGNQRSCCSAITNVIKVTKHERLRII